MKRRDKITKRKILKSQIEKNHSCKKNGQSSRRKIRKGIKKERNGRIEKSVLFNTFKK